MSSRARMVHAYFAASEPQRLRAQTLLAQAGYRLCWLQGDDDAAEQLAHIEVLACAALPQIDWSRATALRHVHVMGAGVDHIDLHALPAPVVITNCRSIHGTGMRDQVLAVMLAFERQLPRLIMQQADRAWQPFVAGTLAGKTLAVLGLGHVGSHIARACRALGMTVWATRAEPERASPFDELADRVLGPADTREVLAAADYVVVCLPATEATRGLLDASMLSAMRPEAALVVVGRGGVVDEDALADALECGALRGAALDVFADEPLPETHRLWSTPRLLLSPHIAGRSAGYIERAMGLLVANMQRLEAGQPALTEVDRARGY